MVSTLRIVLIALAVVVCVSEAKDYCLKVKIESQCSPAEIQKYCVPVTSSSCKEGETFVARGGMCSCDVCIRYVGLGEACVIPGKSFPFCRYPYKCNTNHECVTECSYS